MLPRRQLAPSSPSAPSFLTQVANAHAALQSSSGILPPLRQSASAPLLPALTVPREQIYGKRWTKETKRYLHQRRERRWLSMKAKHCYIDFSVQERAELRRYFDDLAGPNGRMNLEQLENMLISFGIASSREEVAKIADKIDDLKTGELDFEQFLELVRIRNDSKILRIFKEMMEGRLGDRNLNFQTAMSTYRRKLILDVAGGTSLNPEQQRHGREVLQNFSALQRSRYLETVGADLEAEALGLGSVTTAASSSATPSFIITGQAPMGGMETMWRGVCHEQHLVSSRPGSADGRRLVEKPPSPREIVASIVKTRPNRKRQTKGIIILEAPAFDEDASGTGSLRASKDPL